MLALLNRPVPARWLCDQLGLKLRGPQHDIRGFCSLDRMDEDGLSFVLPSRKADSLPAGTVFGLEELEGRGASVIGSRNPRLDFIRAQYLLSRNPGFAPEAEPPRIHPSVILGPGAVIENGTFIGEGSVIGPNAVIRAHTRIGRFCEVKAGAVIGDSGFGFERDERNRPLRMLHLGGVRIGDYVEVGALATVVRGALGDTVLEDYVKIDDHSHVAHNCHIGEGTIITACVEISGSVTVGRNCWIAPNSTIIQKIEIGDGALVGIGSVVLRPVDARAKVFGNPAQKLGI